MKLTKKQQAFADFYIETLNGTQSAIRAGYKESSAAEIASENLRKPNIAQYIEQKMNNKDHDRIASQDEVLEYLTNVMRGNIRRETVVNTRQGYELVNTLPDHKDSIKAAELLGKRYGAFLERAQVEVTGPVVFHEDLEDDSDEES
jgi:phage terminase small subunit